MADETTTKAAPKAKKQNYYQKKVEELQAAVAAKEAENEALKANLEAASATATPSPAVTAAIAEHFDKLDGFVDEHDRAKLKHKEQIAEAKERGVGEDEVIEMDLDASSIRAVGYEGREFAKEHHFRWVNKTGRNGQRVSYHKGKGYFVVRPSTHKFIRPTQAVKEEDTWVWGENILMAESRERFIRARERSYSKMLHQGADMREGTREQINELIRNETGQPKARGGITKSYRDNTWDKVEEGAPILGPSAKTISPEQ